MYKSLSFFIVFILIVSLTVSVIAEDKSKGVKFFKEIKVWTSFQAQNTGDQMKNLTDPTYHLLKNCPVYRDLLPYNANLGLSLTIIKSNNWGINIKFGTKSFMSSANGLFNYKPLFQSYSKEIEGYYKITPAITLISGFEILSTYPVEHYVLDSYWKKIKLGVEYQKEFSSKIRTNFEAVISLFLNEEKDYDRYPWKQSLNIKTNSYYELNKTFDIVLFLGAEIKTRNRYQHHFYSDFFSDEIKNFAKYSGKVGVVVNTSLGRGFIGLTSDYYNFGHPELPYAPRSQTIGIECSLSYNN